MVNTEPLPETRVAGFDYNILNIVVNTERRKWLGKKVQDYNILNIVVNTEL